MKQTGMVYPHLRIRTCFWASPTVLLSFYFSLLCPTPTHRHTKMEGHLYISYFSIVSFFVNKKLFDSVFLFFLKKTRNCFALLHFSNHKFLLFFFFPNCAWSKKQIEVAPATIQKLTETRYKVAVNSPKEYG